MDTPLSDAAPSRAAHILHLAPPEPGRLARLVIPALTSAPAEGSALRTLVLVDDADAAAEVAVCAAREAPDAPRLVALTSAARGRRVLAGSTPTAIVLSAGVAAALFSRSALSLDALRHVILTMPASPDDAATREALDSVMSMVPKSAVRTLVAARETPAVEALVDRHFFKPRRTRETTGDVPASASERPVYVLGTASGARSNALRRLLDETDPPSGAIVCLDAASELEMQQTLSTLGYAQNGPITVTRGPVAPGTALIVFASVPDGTALRSAMLAEPIHLVVLCPPRDLDAVRTVASGAPVLHWVLDGPQARAESREAATRARLREILESGMYARELLAISPLLDDHDASEVAAAALVLASELARPTQMAAPSAAPPPRRDAERERRAPDRPGREDRGRDERGRDDRPRERRPDRAPSRGPSSGPSRGPARGPAGGRAGGDPRGRDRDSRPGSERPRRRPDERDRGPR